MNQVLTYLLLLVLICHAVYTDMTLTIIRNRLIVAGLLFGLIFQIIQEGKIGILVYIVNISIPVVLLYLLFQLHALGAGDIKLFSMIGAFVSTEQLLQIGILSFLIGAVFGAVKLLYRYFTVGITDGKLTQIRFSPAILIAYLVNLWRWTYG